MPLTPAQLYRAGIESTNAHCRKAYGKTFDRIDDAQRQEVPIGLSTGKITFDNGLPDLLDDTVPDRDRRHVCRPDLPRQSSWL